VQDLEALPRLAAIAGVQAGGPTGRGGLRMNPKAKLVLAAALAALAAIVTGSALADAPAGAQDPGSKISGIVPALTGSQSPSPFLGGGNLIYHGGPTMHTNVVYAIFWKPAGQFMSSTYRPLLKQFYTDVAADSGKTSNVYFSDTQYSSILYSSKLGGSFTTTDSFPASGCVDPATTICLSDAQLRAEITHVIAVKGWTTSPTHLFVIFTPRNVGSCFGSGPSGCAYTDYCAYHGAQGSGSTMLVYANQPYAAHAGCDVGERPNGSDADPTINVASHEHNESITDPDAATGWYDNQGFENGDKCAWIFGPESGPAGARYNQTINGHHYLLQMEWSNHSSGCVQTGI
jgi:serine protease